MDEMHRRITCIIFKLAKLGHDLVSLYKLADMDFTFTGVVDQAVAENKLKQNLDAFKESSNLNSEKILYNNLWF